MRWTDKDPDGYNYNIQLPKSFKNKEAAKKFSLPFFNRNFEWGRLTGWELEYLNNIILEYKDVMTSVYRRREIWKSLNWAPVNRQFEDVIGVKSTNKIKFKFVKTFPYFDELWGKKYPSRWEYDGYWVYPSDDIRYRPFSSAPDNTLYGARLETKSYEDNLLLKESCETVPAFVLKRIPGDWDSKMYATRSDGTRTPKNYFIKNGKNILNPIPNPFKTDKDGNIVSIGNLDWVIRAKLEGWRINGQEIPDQEIIHYIRRKYGFGYSENEKTKKIVNPGNLSIILPIINYYNIPFLDDEPNAPPNVGKILYFERPMATLALSQHKESSEEKEKYEESQVVYYDGYIDKQIETLKGRRLWYGIPVQRLWDGDAAGGKSSLTPSSAPWNTYNTENDRKLIFSIIENHSNSNSNEMGWEQIAYFSTIRAHWRAAKILSEVISFSKKLQIAIDKKDAYPVVCEDENGKSNTIFMSAKSSDERPWDELFTDPSVYSSDRTYKKNGDCRPTIQYMREPFYPKINEFISELYYTEKQISQTQKALDKRILFHHPLVLDNTISGKFESDQFSVLREFVESGKNIEENHPKYGVFTYNWLKKPKPYVFWGVFSLITAVEITSFATKNRSPFLYHHSHALANWLLKYIEPGLVFYKNEGNIQTGYFGKSLMDTAIWLGGLYLSNFGATIGKLISVPKHSFIVFAIQTILVTIRAIYDSNEYGSHVREEKQKFIDLIYEASNEGFIEGIYAFSGGKLKVKKGPNGQIPIGIKKSPDGKTMVNEYENFQKPIDGYYKQGENSEPVEQRRKRINNEFLQSKNGERLFFAQLEEIECKTLLDIAKKIILPNGRYNPNLNAAPNHLDIPPYKSQELTEEEIRKEDWSYLIPIVGGKITPNDRGIGIRPDFNIISSDYTGFFEKVQATYLLKSIPSQMEARGPRFFYTRAPITKTTDLTDYLNGNKTPTESYYVVKLSTLPASGRINKTFHFNGDTANWKYGETEIPGKGKISIPLSIKLTDKEKVWLIRKKYGLDEVIPTGQCCQVLDVPYVGGKFPITDDCEYLIDFTSPEFIKKLEEFCGKKEEDKNKEKSKKDKAILDDFKPATTHGQTEEKRVQHTNKMDESRKQDDRRNQKRNTAGYQGTPDSIQNLAQAPRLGVQALIPGNTSYDLPITDSESQQRIAFETLDTERDKTSSLIANILINLAGNLARRSISESISPTTTYIRSTPLEPRAGVYSLLDRISDASTKWWRNTGTTYLGKKG